MFLFATDQSFFCPEIHEQKKVVFACQKSVNWKPKKTGEPLFVKKPFAGNQAPVQGDQMRL
jgi:hypothetical protein